MSRTLSHLLRPFLLGAVALTLRSHQAFPPPGTLVDVGGYRLHLHCSGQGSPTVVLEAGAGDFSFDWSLVQPVLARATRVCSYDRAGYAWSDPGPRPRTIRQITAELAALLTNARIAPPYVLVGHSLGGLIVRAYAGAHPAQVSGLVLIDAAHEDNPIMLNGQLVPIRSLSRGREIPPVRLEAPAPDSAPLGAASPASPVLAIEAPYDRLSPETQRVRLWAVQQPGYAAARRSEFDYLPEELSQIHDQRARESELLGSIPLVVLTRNDAPPDHATRQADLTRLSTDSKQAFAATSDHHIQLYDPGTVIRVVNEVLQAAHTHTRLTH